MTEYSETFVNYLENQIQSMAEIKQDLLELLNQKKGKNIEIRLEMLEEAVRGLTIDVS